MIRDFINELTSGRPSSLLLPTYSNPGSVYSSFLNLNELQMTDTIKTNQNK